MIGMTKDRINIENASDVNLIEELQERGYIVSDEEDIPDDRDIGKPFEMVIPKDIAWDNILRFIDRLETDYGYGVHKDYEGESVVVYNVSPGFKGGSDKE